VLSHADFNVSLLQVCNCSASAIREPVDRLDADPSKVVFVNLLLDRLYDEVRAPGKALPRADGLSMAKQRSFWRQVFAQWCKGKGARTLQVGLLQGRNLFFTSSAQDLIVRFEAKNQSVFDGVAFADAWNPHLATFALDPGGAWELVSFVLFNYPAPPPVGAQCRRDG